MILATALTCTAGLIVGIVFGTLNAYLNLENQAGDDALDRVRALLDDQAAQLAAAVRDYAYWDDTWNYINGDAPEYPDLNLNAATLDNLDLDFAALYGRDNRLRGLFRSSAYSGTPDLPGTLDSGSLPFPASAESPAGMAALSGKPYLLASAAVTRSDRTGPAAGRLIFARELDPEFERTLSRLSGTTTRVISLRTDQAAPEAQERRSLSDAYIRRLSLADWSEATNLVLEVQLDRRIMRQGFRAVVVFTLLALVVALLTMFGYNLTVRMLIIDPIRRLERIATDESGGFAAFYTEIHQLGERRDLIGNLARMIERADQGDRAAAERLEAEVAERTKKLSIYQKIVYDTGEGILITALDGTILETNPAFQQLTGYGEAEIIGRNVRLLKSDRQGPEFYDQLGNQIRREGRWEGEIWNRRKDGSLFPAWLTIDTIEDGQGNQERYIGFIVDITKLKDAEDNLNRLAFYDALTKLPNRSLFMDRINRALSRAQRNKSRIALLYLDLDHFKDVNDGYGHLMGDELLKEAALRIQAQVRDTDTVCRLGGDEFTVILESIHKSEDASTVARKIVDQLKNPFFLSGKEIYVGSSVGIALYPYDGNSVEELVKNADAAMYEAKERGRGQYRFASGAAGNSSRHRVEMETTLRRALLNDNFVIHFQPQVSAGNAMVGSNQGLIGVEALVRLRTEDGSLALPDTFIEIAEDTGLIIPIGEWVLRRSCIEAKRWSDAGKPIQVSVNVSQRQFEKGIIVEQTAAALRDTALDPRLLKLEVTESLFMRDIDRAVAIMEQLKELGITFAVDDFGTGYSSLRYIDALPIDSLKIDKSFIDRISNKNDAGAVALAVVSLARSFGLVSIAEGVETGEQLEALRRRGCDAIQGFYVSKPLSAEEFMLFIAQDGQNPAKTSSARSEDAGLEELEAVL